MVRCATLVVIADVMDRLKESELKEGLTHTRFAMARLKTIDLLLAPRAFNQRTLRAEVASLLQRYEWSPYVQMHAPRTDKHLSRPCPKITDLAESAANEFLQGVEKLENADHDAVLAASLLTLAKEQHVPQAVDSAEALMKSIESRLPQARVDIAEIISNRLLTQMVADFSVADFGPDGLNDEVED